MTADLVPVGTSRLALPNIDLPRPPPTRIYISGFEYRVQAPRVPLPPIANAVKLILKYTLPAAKVANNILHLLTGSSFVTSDPASLQNLADSVFTKLTTGGSAIPNLFTSATALQSVTAKDLGGTSAQATSSGAPVAGVVSGTCHPPQVAVCASWQIAESYRGGKPRTYVPCPPINASIPAGSASLDPVFAAQAESTWAAFLAAINSMTLTGGGSFTLGTISYHTGHAVRPTPLFRAFIDVDVHERLDSQRRRSGKESSYPVTP